MSDFVRARAAPRAHAELHRVGWSSSRITARRRARPVATHGRRRPSPTRRTTARRGRARSVDPTGACAASLRGTRRDAPKPRASGAHARRGRRETRRRLHDEFCAWTSTPTSETAFRPPCYCRCRVCGVFFSTLKRRHFFGRTNNPLSFFVMEQQHFELLVPRAWCLTMTLPENDARLCESPYCIFAYMLTLHHERFDCPMGDDAILPVALGSSSEGIVGTVLVLPVVSRASVALMFA